MKRRWMGLAACMLCLFAKAWAEEAVFGFPCEPEISPFFSKSEHEINCSFDLVQHHRMEIDDWETDVLMVESGSLVILDNQFMLIDLHFSRDFDYAAAYTHLPDRIMLTNQDPCVSDENNPAEWRAWMFPDQDDPYAFHYACTWNPDMACIRFYGIFENAEGGIEDCFSLHIDR